MTDFAVSDNAQIRIANLLKGEKDGTYLRVSVIGGGCSGFQYHFDFDDSATEDKDIILQGGDYKVAVDDVSLEYIKGSVLDYVEMMGGSAFEISNPKAQSSCGCGNSFSI